MVRMTLVIRLSPAQPEIQRINPSHLGVLCLRFAWGLHPRGGPDIPSSAFRPSSLRPDAAVPVLLFRKAFFRVTACKCSLVRARARDRAHQ
jgi:hypothetical protein